MWNDHPFIQRNNAAEQKEGTGRWKKKFKMGVGGRQCRGGGGLKNRGCENPLPTMKLISTMQLKMKNHSLKIISVCIGKR